jgi:hypothetical protein
MGLSLLGPATASGPDSYLNLLGGGGGGGGLSSLLPLLLASLSGNPQQQQSQHGAQLAGGLGELPDLFSGQNQFAQNPFSSDSFGGISPIGPLLQTSLQRVRYA